MAAAEKMLTLRSSDNQELEVRESVAMQSVTIENMIEDGCSADKGIPLPNVTSHILAKVVEYCNKHAGEPNKSAEDELKIFDAGFVKVEQATLLDIILAANHLGIKGLLDLTCQTLADTIKGKKKPKPKEIKGQTVAGIKNERKQMEARFNAFLVHWQKTAKERLTVFAEQGEESRKHGYRPVQPPLEIIKYPELLERAWGWDAILPYSPVNSWSLYMNYLQEYCNRNAPAALAHEMEADDAAADLNLNGDDGNGLAALVNLCINMEGQLLHLLKRRAHQEFDVDEISLNDKLTNCAHQITNVECGGLFPVPTVSLKCIVAEADLLCELLMRETGITSDVVMCCKIRKFAFRFMTYKGPECFAAAATTMATTKEAKLMREMLRNKCRENNGPFLVLLYQELYLGCCVQNM